MQNLRNSIQRGASPTGRLAPFSAEPSIEFKLRSGTLATAEVTEETTTTPAAQNLYEGMFLVESTRFANDPEKVTNALLELIQKAGGTVEAHRPWQDGKLAYPINGRRKALHYLTYFRMPPAAMKDLDRACKLSDTVMRKLFVRHDKTLYDVMVQAVTAPPAGEAPPAEEKKS